MKFLTDENFNGTVYKALLGRLPLETILRVQDVGLRGADDPDVLEWAAINGRIVLTHDVKTFKSFAYDRVIAGRLMPGVFAVSQSVSLRRIVEEITVIHACGVASEWENKVVHIPL